MAGVGFELRAIATGNSYLSTARVFGAAAIIGSGPWLISILTLLVIGLAGQKMMADPTIVARFQVSVTWMFFCSLVISGPVQLTFTRFVADRLYEERSEVVMPNLIGALAMVSGLSLLLSVIAWPLFEGVPVGARVFLAAGLGALSNIWIAVTALSALRQHLVVLGCFLLGYGITFVATLALSSYGLSGLLLGFALGQGALLVSALSALARFQPGAGGAHFAFMRRRNFYLDLALVGLLFNVGVWIDKIFFWFDPLTGAQVLGPLRASEAYDLPIFLAYLSIVPGMAVFLVRVETDFSEAHRAFYDAINRGASLRVIEPLRDEMTEAARRGIVDIVRVQGIVFALCLMVGEDVLRWFGISTLHAPLFFVDAAAVGMQVILLAAVNMFFYLDRRRTVLTICALLVISNGAFTWATQQMGPELYGYGFAASVTWTTVVALGWLSHAFSTLVRDTFMLQPLAS